MKARTRFNRLVAAANKRLATLSPKAADWAKRKTIEHIAFRTAERHCTCGDCGKTFDYKGGGKYIRCPHCGGKTTGKRLPYSQDETFGLLRYD